MRSKPFEQLARLSAERPLPVDRIGFTTRRDRTLSECGLHGLLTAEEPFDSFLNPYNDDSTE